MAFNPIRDLSKADRDQSVKQLGGATQDEISVFGDRLKTTTRLTSQLVEVIKRKNALFKTDLEQIQNLDRRIKRVIPIIPGMAGVAGARFGQRGGVGDGPSLPGIPLFSPGPFIPTRPRGPKPTPTPADVKVDQPTKKEEEERRRQEEESKVRNKVLTEEELSEAFAEIYGEQPVLNPAYIRDPATGRTIIVRPGEPNYPYPDPGKTPIILQDIITVLQEEAKKEKKTQVYQTPDGFLVIVDKNGVPRVTSPKQLKEQREAITNDPGAAFLVITQALLDVVPSGRAPIRQRGGRFTQRPTGGTRAQTTTLNRVESRIVRTYRDRIRREAAANAVIGSGTKPSRRDREAAAATAARQKRFQEKVEARKRQEAARRERSKQRELEKELERQKKVDEEVTRMEQSPEVMEQIAKAEAERAEREFAIEKLFGRKINVDSPEYDVAAAELRTRMETFLDPEFKIPLRSGSVGFILGLDKPESRSKFIDYLLGANQPKGKDINVNFINGILKAVGLDTVGVDAIDAKTTRFIFNFMQSRNLGDKINDVYADFNSRGLLRLDTVDRVKIKKKFNITETGQLELDVNQQQPVGEQSFRGRPLSIDIASLNSQIDNTDVVIVLTGTTA